MLIFFYDKMMTSAMQNRCEMYMKFICFAKVPGELYAYRETKMKRPYLINKYNKTSRVVFGAVFDVNYELNSLKLHSLFSSMAAYTGKTSKDDYYVLGDVVATPITFTSIENLNNSMFKTYRQIKCKTFWGNVENTTIQHTSSKRHWKGKNIDKESFITLVKKINREKEKEKWLGTM